MIKRKIFLKLFLGFIAIIAVCILTISVSAGIVLNGDITSILWIALIGALVAGFFALLLSIFIARTLTEPLADMVYVVRNISEGIFRTRAWVRSKDEIGTLAESINKMSENLEERIKTISEHTNELMAILSSMIEGVVAIDENERVMMINEAAKKMFNLYDDSIIGRPYWEIIRNNELYSCIARALAEGHTRSAEITDALFSNKVFRAQVAPIFELPADNQQGKKKVTGAVLVFNDITDIRRLENMRIDFVANVSHELKTPITSIKGFVETLKERALNEPENARKFLDIIENHTNRLNNLINDLLNLSRIESKDIPLKITEINPLPVINKVAGGLTHRFQEKRQVLSIEFPDNFPQIMADESLLEQAITNLLDNAIKYTEDGGKITVSGTTEKNWIRLEVADTGIGIPLKDLPRIFERFYRVDKARSREMGGTGLGLAIVKHIMAAHGGSVTVESKLGAGSKFTLLFPKTQS
ncbi:MAG TPA: ATP-binding protein [Candidatus Brocadiales bacterium]|nr:ATP-binding protein [Candidatus Brocadiales bacterium]